MNCSRIHFANARTCLLAIVVSLAGPCGALQGNNNCQSSSGSEDEASQLLEQGNNAYVRHDFATAEARWLQVHDCAHGTRDWPKAVYNLGLLESDRRNFPRAIRYFNEVIQSHPNDREPGGSLMETNRNYSHRSAMAISRSYEKMGAYGASLRYALLAKNKYTFSSWCGTCVSQANFEVDKRIAYLAVRASRMPVWTAVFVFGFIALHYERKKHKSSAGGPKTGRGLGAQRQG